MPKRTVILWLSCLLLLILVAAIRELLSDVQKAIVQMEVYDV